MTPDLLGTLPQWLAALGIGGVLVALVRRDVQVRGLKNTDLADIRDHYAQEVEAMRGQLMAMERHYREMLQQSDKRHEECEAARTVMRNELDGLKQQLKMYSSDQVLVMERDADPRPPSERAPLATAAAERVKKIVEGDK